MGWDFALSSFTQHRQFPPLSALWWLILRFQQVGILNASFLSLKSTEWVSQSRHRCCPVDDAPWSLPGLERLAVTRFSSQAEAADPTEAADYATQKRSY